MLTSMLPLLLLPGANHTSAPSANGGRCVDLIGKFACNCLSGSSGATCGTKDAKVCPATNECDKVNARCTVNFFGSPVCVCHAGFSSANAGKTCTPAKLCTPTTCKNSGTCNKHVGYTDCTCGGGYTGLTCATPPPVVATYDKASGIGKPCKVDGDCGGVVGGKPVLKKSRRRQRRK